MNEKDEDEEMQRLFLVGLEVAREETSTLDGDDRLRIYDTTSTAILHAVAAMIVASKKPICIECNDTGYSEIDSRGTKIRCVCTYEIGEEILGRR